MVNPQTYTETSLGISVTADDAKKLLDYQGVVAACDNILDVANNGMKTIANNISNVPLGKETLCVEDKSLEPYVDEIQNAIKSYPEQGIAPALEEIKAAAAAALDELQTQKNEAAKASYDSKVQAARAASTTN